MTTTLETLLSPLASDTSAQDASLAREQRFTRFVDQHRDRAVRMAWRLTGEDLATAEEVAQDAFIRAYRGLGRFRDDAELSTWFYRILVRQAANHRRWRGVRERWNAFWDQTAPLPAPRIPLGDPGLRKQIALAMDQLTEPQRTTFTLVHLEGFTIVEVAEMTGRAPGTVKSHLHRALAVLRAELSPLQQENPR